MIINDHGFCIHEKRMRKVAIICFEILRDSKQNPKNHYGISLEQLPKNGIRKRASEFKYDNKRGPY